MPTSTFTMGPVTVDVSLRETTVRGKKVELSRKEFDLLALLVSEAGHVVTRKQCMEKIWRDRTKGDSRTLDTHGSVSARRSRPIPAIRPTS